VATMLAEVTRGPLVESAHQGNVAVVDAEGRLIASGGDVESRSFFRSSAKPFQGVPLVISGTADAYGFTTEELALACASHNATERHQAIVSSMLKKAGFLESDLRCGFSPPFDKEENARITLGLKEPTQIRCECSGKHAGMLAVCRHNGWPTDNYTALDHPLQQEILSVVGAACNLPSSAFEIAIDGCTLPTFAAPIRSFALAFAVLADPEGARWEGESAHRAALVRLREAFILHPELVSGEGEIDTTIMRTTQGRVVAKLGTEGLLCMAVPEHRLGVAISDSGGSTRSLGPAAISVLEELKLEDESTIASLREQLCPPIQNFAGEPVGETRPALRLERA
jgi:L-asparaginase II